MQARRINIPIYLLLLAIIISGSACSLTKIRAQNSERKPETVSAGNKNTTDSSETDYKPPKRVSKDIIKTGEKDTAVKPRAK